MEYSVTTTASHQVATACLVVGVHEGGALTPSARKLDELLDGLVTRLMERGDMKGKRGETLLLHDAPGTAAKRVLLVGLGPEDKLDDRAFAEAVAAAARAIDPLGAGEAAMALAELAVPNRAIDWRIQRAVVACDEALYRFDQMKSKAEPPLHPLAKVSFTVADAEADAAREAVTRGKAVADGVRLARDLGNLPGNVCTPTYLAEQAKSLAASHAALSVEVLEEKDMAELHMGALLSVAKGSRQPPKLIVMAYRNGPSEHKPVVLVGKGITFDAGGISIKPAQAMDEMKFDMCGAAATLGIFTAVLALRLPVNLIGVVPACENLPDGNANKPGDIVTSMAGHTIEVLNTDAEGRLILCDALTYSERFEPDVIIDMATLTGACVVALGKHASGLFSNDQALAEGLLAAGQASGDRAWRLPLWEEYDEQLKTNFADVANIGGREAGAITAASFLHRFTKAQRWAHLDIAGTAWKTGNEKGATGRPVGLIVQYLLDRLTV